MDLPELLAAATALVDAVHPPVAGKHYYIGARHWLCRFSTGTTSTQGRTRTGNWHLSVAAPDDAEVSWFEGETPEDVLAKLRATLRKAVPS